MNNSCWNCGAVQDCGCKTCHKCNYTTPLMEPVDLTKAKTQKVKGISALQQAGLSIPAIYFLQQEKKEGKPNECGSSPLKYPAFARPCPVRPRHGFVDSRVVKNEEERKALSKETFKADPDGEILYMEPIDAVWNAIWTPHLLTIGDGYDGATAGKGAVSVPLAGVMPKQLSPKILDLAAFTANDYPYVEVVGPEAGRSAVFTQLRAGPKLEGTQPDYIPTKVKVTKVVNADLSMSLLEWEKIVLSLDPEAGHVVYHPTGSLTDHISVHARTKGIATLKTFEPKVGQVLEPIPAPEWDPQQILKGAALADAWELSDNTARQACNFLLLGLHNAAALTGESSKWIGIAVTMMLKLGSVACRGELRHAPGAAMGAEPRQKVWAKMWKRSIQFHRASLSRMANVFRYGRWESRSFGGYKWAQCAFAMGPLYNALGALAKDPTKESAGALIRALNVAVNQAHNGGWWLNKFTDSMALDQIQKANLPYVMDTVPFIRTMTAFEKEAKPEVLERRIQRMAEWQPVTIHPPRVQECEAIIVPYSGGLNLRIKTRLTRVGKEIQVPFEKFSAQAVASLGELVLVAEDEGMRVEAKKPGQDPVVLWKEDPVVPAEVPAKK